MSSPLRHMRRADQAPSRVPPHVRTTTPAQALQRAAAREALAEEEAQRELEAQMERSQIAVSNVLKARESRDVDSRDTQFGGGWGGGGGLLKSRGG